jgi:thiamine biosynthesis lipoprotein
MANTLTFDALGTAWHIFLEEAPDQNSILELVRSFEDRYSRFQPESLVSQLNDQKCLSNPPEELRQMLEYCLHMYKETEGLFNISIGATLELHGYGRRPDSNARVSENLHEDLVIRPDEIWIAPHMRLDFGGFGKGWLLDLLVAQFREKGVTKYLINGGGDIAVGDDAEKLFIEHPFMPKQHVGSVTIHNAALAGSSNNKRRWHSEDGNEFGHIHHPTAVRTKLETSAAHVIAPTALLADTLATVLILADDPLRDRLAATFAVDYLIIEPNGSYHHTKNFPFVSN